MDRRYRIDGAGDEAAFLEAAQRAEQAVADLSGTGGSSGVLASLTYLLSAAGASGAAYLLLGPVLETALGLAPPATFMGAILVGTGLYVLVLVLLNRWISRGMASAYLSQPIMQNHHVLLTAEGMRVVSGQTYTHFDWSDVTRIELSSRVILVMAGMAYAHIPLDGFADQDEARAAIADMRRWQAEARA